LHYAAWHYFAHSTFALMAAKSHSGAYANMAQTLQFHEKRLSLLIGGWTW